MDIEESDGDGHFALFSLFSYFRCIIFKFLYVTSMLFSLCSFRY